MIIAITSSIGCGKTTVTNIFKHLENETLDIDKLAKKVMKKKEIKKQVLKEFGTLNSKQLSEKVFSSKNALKKLNAIVHPIVLMKLKKIISIHRKQNKTLIVDIPLLFETQCANLFDSIIVVKCSKKNQLKRLLKKGLTKKEVLKRIKAQIPLQKKLKNADIIVYNDGLIKSTAKQVILINNFLKELNK